MFSHDKKSKLYQYVPITIQSIDKYIIITITRNALYQENRLAGHQMLKVQEHKLELYSLILHILQGPHHVSWLLPSPQKPSNICNYDRLKQWVKQIYIRYIFQLKQNYMVNIEFTQIYSIFELVNLLDGDQIQLPKKFQRLQATNRLPAQ